MSEESRAGPPISLMYLLRYLKRLVREPRLFRSLFVDVKKPIITTLAECTPDFFFIQIGAHDGKSLDPIHGYVHRYGWQGILVEPQPKMFERLTRNYAKHEGLHFVPAAISDTDGDVTFYLSRITTLSSLHADEWFKGRNDGIAYANRTRFGSSVPIIVEGMTWKSLLERHSVSRVDLLQIDTDGSDFDIIRQIDFNAVRPAIIVLEVVHYDDATRSSVISYLAERGYQVDYDGWNVIGYTA
ncbi:MAG: FkbM family methyltransferase [Spirochaetota bacterium]